MLKLGCIAKDKVTGIEGTIVIWHDYLYGIPRLAMQPPGSFEGKSHEMIHADLPQFEFVRDGEIINTTPVNYGIELGDIIKCKITGFEGVCMCLATFVYSCTRVGVQPKKLNKDGKPVDVHYFDAPQMEIVKKVSKKETVVIKESKKTGGFNPSIATKVANSIKGFGSMR